MEASADMKQSGTKEPNRQQASRPRTKLPSEIEGVKRKRKIPQPDPVTNTRRVANYPDKKADSPLFMRLLFTFNILIGAAVCGTMWFVLGIKEEVAALKKGQELVATPTTETTESVWKTEWSTTWTREKPVDSSMGSDLVKPDPKTYVVQIGDTLTQIAESHNVTVSDIQKWNQLSEMEAIEVGQILIITDVK